MMDRWCSPNLDPHSVGLRLKSVVSDPFKFILTEELLKSLYSHLVYPGHTLAFAITAVTTVYQ